MDEEPLLSIFADLLVVLHLSWVAFMVGGVLATLAGLVWGRILRYRLWRWLHLAGMAYAGFLSATGRLCPLTSLEHTLRRKAGSAPGAEEGFVIRLANRLIFPRLDADLLAAITLVAAGIVLVVFVWKPPGRQKAQTEPTAPGEANSKR